VWYGAKSAALKRFVGRRVLIAVDNQDVSKAYAYTPDRERRQLIGRLEPDGFRVCVRPGGVPTLAWACWS
jgi:hypothetical protein